MAATRFYLPSAAAAATGIPTPTFDASWDFTTGAIRRWLELSKNAPLGQIGQKVQAVNVNSPAGAVDALQIQFVSAPLDSNQTISGNVKGQVGSSEANAAADMRAQIVIWVYTGSGSRGTLYAGDTAALANEFSVFGTVTNRKYPRGGSTALSSVAAQTGDRIVVEIGCRKGENATTSRNMIHVFGNPQGATDLPEDETDTSQSKAPWIEFDSTITFSADTLRESQVAVEVLNAGTPEMRESQLAVEVLRPVASVPINVAQIVWVD